MTNPFENPEGNYLVLRNHEGQHSLWPAHLAVPAGWETVHGEAGLDECREYVERYWTDMRPVSLAARMDSR
ncbi:MbtH family protein [Amycolatopsis magusensis]|uniref:MbtH protein n=1 Tax=Amycolatopsis magusensis TaxID=882444 RepID=A0ABS4PVL3_9PSEU|nr:MbtH family protein [Amycolatopsis magusensis]MBP2183467.1 MbtH protein [Amycolatopsis magusensis]MDI5979170.1 MbtH family protein [Amycolatopsis magusensis]